MSYQVLARKWRPQTFDEVIGQSHVTETLKSAIRQDRLAHAYLMSGPRGVGKTSVARILAKAINCREGEGGNPCNRCRSCRDITQGSSVDVQEIDGASNRGIEEIREIRENVTYMPSSSPYRIYIIDEVHMLTLPAFNALLKTLEEPPAHVKFLFATTETHKVPATILSRCQRFEFKRLTEEPIAAHLRMIAEREGIAISPQALALIAREALGSMRDGESLLDQVVSLAGAQVEKGHVLEALGVMDRDILLETARSVLEGAADRCLSIVEEVYGHGYDMKEYYRNLLHQFRDLLVCLIAPGGTGLEGLGQDPEEVTALARKAGLQKIQLLVHQLMGREQDMRYTSEPRILMEAILVGMCHVGSFLSLEEVLQRIASLESRLLGKGTGTAGGPSRPVQERSLPSAPQGASSPEAPDPPRQRGWPDFLAFLARKNKPMHQVLHAMDVAGLSGSSLTLRRGKEPFRSRYLDDKERRDLFLGYCREFFGTDMDLRFVSAPEEGAGEPAPEKDLHVRAGDGPRQGAGSPLQQVLEAFEGRVYAPSGPVSAPVSVKGIEIRQREEEKKE